MHDSPNIDIIQVNKVYVYIDVQYDMRPILTIYLYRYLLTYPPST